MPLLQTCELNPNTILGIWQMGESVHELWEMLPPHLDASLMGANVHPRRKREWLSSRILVYQLLKRFTDKPLILERNAQGKPFFAQQGMHVSITHSPCLAAVILSDAYEVGTDIELITPKALRVADKFLSEAEKAYTRDNELETCLYWSVKETLYKMYSRKQLVFKTDIRVSPTAQNDVLQGLVRTENFSKLYQVHHTILQNHVLTYCIDSASNPG